MATKGNADVSFDDFLNAAQLFFWVAIIGYYSWKFTAWFCRRFCGCLAPCCCCCRRCCCRQPQQQLQEAEPQPPPAPTKVILGDQEVPIEDLKKRKELKTAYGLFFTAGLLGFHHFYLDRFVHGLFCMWTLNFLCMGWLIDLCLLPVYVSGANSGLSPVAPSDGSCRRICTRLPCASVLLVVVATVLIVGTPPALQNVHILDLESIAAETAGNPYTILGVSRNCSKAEADEAARIKIKAASLGSPRCDKACKDRLNELKKAQKFASGRAWRESEEAEKPEKPEKAKKESDKPEKSREKRNSTAPHWVFPAGGWVDLAFYSTHCWKAMLNRCQRVVSDGFEDLQEKGVKEVGKEYVKYYFPRFYEWANSTHEESPPSSGPFDDEL